MSLKHDVIEQLVKAYNNNSFACLGELLAEDAIYDDGERWVGKKMICRHFQALSTTQWIQNHGIIAQSGYLVEGEEVVLHMDDDLVQVVAYMRVSLNEQGRILALNVEKTRESDLIRKENETLLDRKGIYRRTLYLVFKHCFRDQEKKLLRFNLDPEAIASIEMLLDGKLTYIHVSASVGQLLGKKRDKIFVEGFRAKCKEDQVEGIMIRACIAVGNYLEVCSYLPIKNGTYQLMYYEFYGKDPDEVERTKLLFDDTYKIAQIDEFPLMKKIVKEFRECFQSLDFNNIYKRLSQDVSCYDFWRCKESFGKEEVTSFFDELVDEYIKINKIVDSHLMILRYNGSSEKMAAEYEGPYLPYFSGEPTLHVCSPLHDYFMMVRFTINPMGQIDTIYLVPAYVYVRRDGEYPEDMDRIALHQYGIKVMVQDLLSRDYEVTMMRDYPEPHIQACKDDKIYDMVVRTSRYPYHPRFTQEEFKDLEEFCRHYETIALFAEVSCWGSDERKWDVRMDEKFHCEFDVLIIDPESEETDRIWT